MFGPNTDLKEGPSIQSVTSLLPSQVGYLPVAIYRNEVSSLSWPPGRRLVALGASLGPNRIVPPLLACQSRERLTRDNS